MEYFGVVAVGGRDERWAVWAVGSGLDAGGAGRLDFFSARDTYRESECVHVCIILDPRTTVASTYSRQNKLE